MKVHIHITLDLEEQDPINDAFSLCTGRSILDHAIKSQEQDIINRRILRQIHQKQQDARQKNSEKVER